MIRIFADNCKCSSKLHSVICYINVITKRRFNCVEYLTVLNKRTNGISDIFNAYIYLFPQEASAKKVDLLNLFKNRYTEIRASESTEL